MQGASPFEVIARYQATAPVDLDAIARDLGLAVRRAPLGRQVAGQIMRDPMRGGRSGFSIFINSDEHPNRQRFTLAHEIAHFVLHRDLIEDGIVDDTMYRSEMSNAYEAQANKMAADIIMPVRLVKRLWPSQPSPEAMAKAFGVSTAAMKIRLDGLGLKSNQSSMF
jgi:hypothetical protein